MVIKIFQNKSKGLSEINEIGGKKPFDYEKMIQTLVEKNIETIFPELEFVFTEFPLDELRIDSVAFNKESNSFVILEYKNIKHGGVIDQGMAYLDLLEDKREAFVLLYNNEKEKSLKMDDVEWDESKVIIIATEFTPHQLRSANRTKDPIELYQIARFEDGIITVTIPNTGIGALKTLIKVTTAPTNDWNIKLKSGGILIGELNGANIDATNGNEFISTLISSLSFSS